MTHFWIIEANSAQELAMGIKKELKAGARLEGAAYVSRNRKHYQAITREVAHLKKLEAHCLGDLANFQIN